MFKKEHGCKNCGFSFCSKCLSEKPIPVPRKNNAKHRVCHKCLKILKGEVAASADQRSYDLPEAYLKRVAALKEKGSASTHATAVQNKSSPEAQNIPSHLHKLSKEDREIAMRLEKLKEGRKVDVSDADLNARLAQLKGQTYNPEKKPIAYQAPDRRTQVEQVDDLLEQLCEEVEIDSLRPDPVKDIESRLTHLRQGPVNEKPAADTNNLNLQDKSKPATSFEAGKNDLGKEDKMGAFARQGSQNIHSTSDKGEISMEEMQQLMAQAAQELEHDAHRSVLNLYKDQKLMEKLKEIQSQGQQEHSSDNTSGHPTGASGGLSGQIAGVVEQADSSDEENEDEQANKVLQRFLEEAKLDQKVEQDNVEVKISNDQKKGKRRNNAEDSQVPKGKPHKPKDSDSCSDYDDSDELPYCCICTEDATIRCRDCDLDLYCSRCFRESHQEMEMTDHRTSPYKAPKGYR